MQQRAILFVIALAVSLPMPALADFTPIAGWDRQLFPSYLIGTATIKTGDEEAEANVLGDPNGLLGISIVAPEQDTEIEVIIECNEFAEPSRFVGRLENEGETYILFPKMKYRFDRLSQCSQATPASVSYRVVIGGNEVEEKSTNVTFRSINDCPLKVVLGETVIDTSFTFASYVNEQHPFIDKLLREALDIGVVKNFVGYQAKKEEQVLLQVYAIWDLLVARDVRYSSITKTAADSEIISSQNVRLLEDTINNQQANCVDGSVLLVSILRKIDIDAKLIFVPGHCFIGFYLDPENTKFVALETTLLGAEVATPNEVHEDLDNAIDESVRGEYSWPSFVAAIAAGNRILAESETKEGGNRIVDISAARRIGVLPIPHRNQEVFVKFDHTSDDSDDDEGSDMESESPSDDESIESGDVEDASDEEEQDE
jgi:hypothetical protein